MPNAHTYERVDKPCGEFFHTNWTGTGGRVASRPRVASQPWADGPERLQRSREIRRARRRGVPNAHTYERVDKSRGEFFHTNWTGTGGRVASSTYTV